MDPIPLPQDFPNPPPDFLRRRAAYKLLEFWGIGERHMLDDLVEKRRIHAIPRPPLRRGFLYKTSELFGIYTKIKAGYIQQLLITSRK